MGIASTRSRSSKRKGHGGKRSRSQQGGNPRGVWETSPAQSAAEPREARAEAAISERTWFIACAAILLVAAFLRFYDLNLVPLHHDEGVNGNFLVHLVREGSYHYDPANYHGPTLYYFAAIFPWILRLLIGPHTQDKYGLSTVAIRCVPALFGMATIILVLTLRRKLGTIATLSAALLLAVSPGAVYLSRYFIHETLFVFFTLGLAIALFKFLEDAHPLYLILAALSAALLFATKETAIISAAVLVIALVLTRVYRSLWERALSGRRGRKTKSRSFLEEDSDYFLKFIERLGGPGTLAISSSVALVIFIAVNVLFYSSFFTNYPQGVYDSLKTFQFWTKTGKEAHVHPFVTYIWWLLLQESPLLILGAIGAMLVVLKPSKSFALFSALWAFGLIAAYSLIAYKTPWLSLNFIVPLALIGGYAIEVFYEELGNWEVTKLGRWSAIAGILLLAIGPLPGVMRFFDQQEIDWKTFVPGYQTVDLNFINYDNDNRYYVYVYAHTRREMLKMVDQINQLAQRTHEGTETGITIVSPDYWPLPWYLRDYKRVGYFGHMSASTEPIIIARQDQAAEVQTTFGERYQQIHSGFNPTGTFPLRPGVDLLLYTRRELAP
ncbi:MAG TPA: flippase activity-associated protein Agl23 [Pyrinomonadaceae bacterium]